ncbi:MAG TPA: crotonase/enoyl-CoA hydratase family protein [Solirubrobacteraceae bacterium]|jgi:enoyl-CoA hydratase
MGTATTLRTETSERVRSIVLSRAGEYNTITPALRDELALAISEADGDPGVAAILLRAEGPAFCAGYGLDWATEAQIGERQSGAVWDSVTDMRLIGGFVEVFQKLWYAKKPTIAAVGGWCIGGGTDMVLCADLIIAGDDARFGYPPARVWGTPTTAMWVYRLGFQTAKRYLLTGDEISAQRALEIGLVCETVPASELAERAFALAARVARLPINQLIMIKALCNQPAENMGLASSRQLGTLFDGVARHTQEGLDFLHRAEALGFREAVRERDDPFGDYGSRVRGGD